MVGTSNQSDPEIPIDECLIQFFVAEMPIFVG